MAQMVKNLPAMQETQYSYLGNPMDRGAMGLQRVGHNWVTLSLKKKKKSEPDHLQQFLEEVSSSKVILFWMRIIQFGFQRCFGMNMCIYTT